jgi:hypothetical protein
MEVANGSLYDTQQITNNERSKTPSADVRMSLALPGEFPPSSMALVGPERAHVCTGPDNSTGQTTNPASETSTSPSHGVASGKEMAFYRDEDRSSRDAGFADSSNGEDLLHMAQIILELLRDLSTRNAEAHVKTTTGQQRRFHRFVQKAHRAKRWIYRSVQQTGLTMARQQIQMLEQGLDGQAEFSPVMAGDAGTLWALAQRYPLRIRIPSTLALVMRFLPEGVKRSINHRDRADVARVFVALVNRWLFEAGGEGALTTRGTMRQLASAEKSAKVVEAE